MRFSLSLVIWCHHSNKTKHIAIVASRAYRCVCVWICLLDWMLCRCRHRWWSQPFLGRQSCYANGSSRLLASRVAALLSSPCVVSWSKPMVCVSIHGRNVCVHGYASIQPIGHWNWIEKKLLKPRTFTICNEWRQLAFISQIIFHWRRYSLWHIKQLVQIHTAVGEFTERTLLLESFVNLNIEKKSKLIGLRYGRVVNSIQINSNRKLSTLHFVPINNHNLTPHTFYTIHHSMSLPISLNSF